MSRTIMLADDSVTIQKVVELTFLDRDYSVTAVTNGDDAVKKLTELLPDLVIADVHMPGANGYDVCRQAKQLRPELPVLLLVGTFEPFDEQQARECGSDGYLKKPFDSQELMRRVEELLEGGGGDANVAAAGGPQVAEAVPPPPPVSSLSGSESDPAPADAGAVPAPVEAAVPGPSSQGVGTAMAEKTIPDSLSEDQLERIARRVVELIGEKVVREVAWEVIPDLAEVVIKDRLKELEEQVEKL